MHAIRSRFTQAQSTCRCRLCLSPINTVVRRTTTAAPRRRVRPAEIFTAFYTTILGTATIIDHHRKEDRKRELDQRLENARAAVNELTTQRELANLPEEGQDGHSNLPESLEENAGSHLPEGFAELDQYGTPKPLRNAPRLPWMQSGVDWADIQAAILEEENEFAANWKDWRHREPRSDMQLEKRTVSVLKLVDRLVDQAFEDPISAPMMTPQVSEEQSGYSSLKNAEATLQDVEDMREEQVYPAFQHPKQDSCSTFEARRDLCQAFRQIFEQSVTPAEKTGKVCYNLLVSTVPPCIHTYNALIAGFNSIRRPDLAQTVIDSFIGDTSLRATEMTAISLLNHYRDLHNASGYRDVISRMRGHKGTGLHYFCVPRTRVINPWWLRARAPEASYKTRKNTFVQQTSNTDRIFDTIIKGWLAFGDVRFAVTDFGRCVRASCVLPIHTFKLLLMACLDSLDAGPARNLITAIDENLLRFLHMLQSMMESAAASTAACVHVIQLLSQVVDAASISFERRRSPRCNDWAKTIQNLKSLIHTSMIELNLRATSETWSPVSDMLHNTESISVANLDACIQHLETGLQQKRLIIQTTKDRYSRHLKLLSLDRRLRDRGDQLAKISAPAIAAILKARTGIDLEAFDFPGAKHELGWCRALWNIDLDASIRTINDIKRELARALPNRFTAERVIEAVDGDWDRVDLNALITFYYRNAANVASQRRPTKPMPGDVGPAYVEYSLWETQERIKHILFWQLNRKDQLDLRLRHSNWFAMPMKTLHSYCLPQLTQTVKVEAPEQANKPTSQHTRPAKPQQDYAVASAGPHVVPRPVSRAVPHADFERVFGLEPPPQIHHSLGASF